MVRRADTPPLTRGVVVRGAIFALAVAMGAVAVWLIVTSTTQKRIELGILAGLWGLLLGTFSMLGNRRTLAVPSSHDAVSQDERPHSDDAGFADARAVDAGAADAALAGAAVELRSVVALEREADAEERRSWQARFEQLMRHEIRDAMSDEVSSLRAEIASLRGELLEKVGGQLRLERIETTRLIGSDLEALQHEVRQLKFAADGAEFTDASEHRSAAHPYTRPVVEPAQTRPVSRHTVDVESDVQPARRPEPVVEAPATQPATRARPDLSPRPSPAPGDDLASLPRLSPFIDDAPEPAEREAAPSPNGYSGRRRRQDEQDAERQRAGRHADRSTGRRHRRDDDDGGDDEDVLTRLLSRDGAR